MSPQELVHWDGIVFMDGAMHNTSFLPHIANTKRSSHWLEIVRAIKRNKNHLAKKRGDDGCDPAQKFDCICKCLVHNVNALTLRANLDLRADETTWEHAGHGEPKSGLLCKRPKKPTTSKGGQLTVMSDVHRMRPHLHVHRHKCHHKCHKLGSPDEARMVIDKAKMMKFDGTDHTNKRKAIFEGDFHMTWDNCFSGNQIMHCATSNNVGMTMTARRDRLPKGVPSKFLQKEKVNPNDRSCAARFVDPIFLNQKRET